MSRRIKEMQSNVSIFIYEAYRIMCVAHTIATLTVCIKQNNVLRIFVSVILNKKWVTTLFLMLGQ